MRVKVFEYREEAEAALEGHEWPYCSSLGDTLRASMSCPNVETLVDCWARLDAAFDIKTTGRVKVRWRL